MDREKKARQLHRSGASCSQAAYMTYAELIGTDEVKARRDASGWAGGAKILCGAVYACEQVIRQVYGEQTNEKISRFEDAFKQINGSVECRKLLATAGKNRRSCNDFVGDASAVLENMLRRDGILTD